MQKGKHGKVNQPDTSKPKVKTPKRKEQRKVPVKKTVGGILNGGKATPLRGHQKCELEFGGRASPIQRKIRTIVSEAKIRAGVCGIRQWGGVIEVNQQTNSFENSVP